MSSRWLTNEDETAPPPVNLNHLVRNATYDEANHKIVLQKHDNITTVDVDITTLGAHDTSLTQHSTDIGNLQSTATTQGNTLATHTSSLATHTTDIGTLQPPSPRAVFAECRLSARCHFYSLLNVCV